MHYLNRFILVSALLVSGGCKPAEEAETPSSAADAAVEASTSVEGTAPAKAPASAKSQAEPQSVESNIETVQVLQDFSDPASVENWVQSANMPVTYEAGENPAVRISIDMSNRFNGWCQLDFPEPLDTSRANAIRYRWKGDGTGTKLKHWIAVNMPDGSTRNYARVLDDELVDEEWQTQLIPLTYFRIPNEDHNGRITGLAFIMQQNLNAPASASSILVDDLELVYDPSIQSHLIEVETDEEFFDRIDTERPELAAVKAALKSGDMPAAKAAFVEHMRTRTEPRFYLDFHNKEAVMETYADLYGGDFFTDPAFKKRTLEFYGYVLDSGAEVRSYPDGDIVWSNAKNGTRYTWTAIISRFWMFRDLGMAYWARDDERYAERAWDYFEDYTAKWPLQQQGELMPNIVGWDHSMGVGERLRYWILGYNFLMNAEASTVDRQIELFKRMIEHAQWLYAVSDMGYRFGNHQIVEVATLIEAAIFLPESKLAKTWLDMGFDRLQEHLDKEVYADGAYLELTPGYHNWCAEKFITPVRLAQINGYELPEGFYEKTQRMYEWVLGFMRPDRTQVAVGDSPSSNLRNIMSAAAAVYEKPEFAFVAEGVPLAKDWFWFVGAEGAKTYANLVPREPDYLFYNPDPSRFIALRTSWDKDAHYMFFNVVPDGSAGHSHPDSLAVDVSVFGKTILKDVGSLGYGNRNHALFAVKTRGHSVLTVDGKDLLTEFPEYIGSGESDAVQWASGAVKWHDGIRHERRVVLVKDPGYFIVEDTVTGEGSRRIDQLWRFAPDVAVAWNDSPRAVVGTAKGVSLEIRPLLSDGWQSLPNDGLVEFAGKPPGAVFSEQVELPYRQVFVLLPEKDAAPAPQVTLEQVETVLKELK